MIALAKGVSVYAGGRTWVNQIPEHLCPANLKPAAAPAGKQGKAQPAAPVEEG